MRWSRASRQLEHATCTGYGHQYLAWNEPTVEPPGECLPNTEVFRRLAGRLGLTEKSLYDTDVELAEQALSGRPPVALRDHPGPAAHRRTCPVVHARSVPAVRQWLPPPRPGNSSSTRNRPPATAWIRCPGFIPAAEVADDRLAARYPVGADLVGLTPFPQYRVWQQPGTAPPRRGSFLAEVWVADWVRPGVAVTTKGHWTKLTGSGVNATVEERDADLGSGAVYHDTGSNCPWWTEWPVFHDGQGRPRTG